FVEFPCPPDLVGLNYYVTSERFLDSRVELYPPAMVGGNGRHAYADVEAVRVCADGLVGPTCFLVDAYERYDKPVAITEAHLGCSPEQQIRWLAYVWNSAQTAHALGVDVRAVTAWALFGAYGWDRLVTEGPGRYEPGVFDVSPGFPIETPLSDFVRALASGEFSPLAPGWWEVEARLLYEPHVAPKPERKSRAA
ncbi:MAG TPA: dTDP-4-dehydrorhamnose reductase, partial [Polyangiaceae bacterium]|nr:dTDP-4-dehydrorhamnose reductase [Polyangiaceae bacterium]